MAGRVRAWLLGGLSLALLSTAPAPAQTGSFRKNFTSFKDVAPEVDFYARSRSDIAAFEKPVRETQQKLSSLLSRKLAKGAIVVCSTMEQKDSVQEKSVLKLGYSWVIIQLTPEAETLQRIETIKARMGNMLPPGAIDMMRNRSPEQRAAGDARMIGPMMQKMAFAMLQTTLLPEKAFKSSRVDDLSRSPLADWLDLGLAWYASGVGLNMRFLQERLDETFPLEDALFMSRPFVAPSGDGVPGGGPAVVRLGDGAAQGGMLSAGTAQAGNSPGGGRQQDASGHGRGGEDAFLMTLPKDVQDRMIFDSQAASLFSYVLSKLGVEKVKSVVQGNLEGKLTSEILCRADYLGPDTDKIESDWRAWVKGQKPEELPINRVTVVPGKTPSSPH